MKYMMMMHGSGKGWKDSGIGTWPPADIKAHINFMLEFNKRISATGEFVTGQGLSGPEDAKIVRAGKDGRPITDGVFPESKEFLAGFWIIDVESEARALELAAEVSAAPGKGGVPVNMPIELRQVMSGPPEIE